MDSDPAGIGPLNSVECCFVLRWRSVVAVPVQPVLVEPVHPVQHGELELVDVTVEIAEKHDQSTD